MYSARSLHASDDHARRTRGGHALQSGSLGHVHSGFQCWHDPSASPVQHCPVHPYEWYSSFGHWYDAQRTAAQLVGGTPQYDPTIASADATASAAARIPRNIVKKAAGGVGRACVSTRNNDETCTSVTNWGGFWREISLGFGVIG